jgi:two-component system CheB/CheR fusion protein
MAQRKSRPTKKAAPARKRAGASRTKGRKPRAAEHARPDSDEPKAKAKPAKADGASKPDSGTRDRDGLHFPVVALGASLGGVAALEQFFGHVPDEPGMAFVVITHQAPDHASLLPQLISRHVTMPVTNIEDGMVLAPNHIYVTPAGTSLMLRDERLQLVPIDHRSSGALPIDAAFRSLAQAYGERMVAVVLSGSGSDGSLGLFEVKNAFGMAIAQDPNTAQASGMPTSAIGTHLVDYVLSPAHMADQIMRYVTSHVPKNVERVGLDRPSADNALHKILSILRTRTGSDFSAYKKSTIRRRIERRMHVHGMSSPEEYARFLEHTAYEIDALFRELLISVTSFFRDEQAYQVLEHELTRLIELKTDNQPLRAWIAGCATGEEAYSIAIVFKEVLQRSGKELKVQIFATDLDQQAVDVARTGRYPEGIAADVSPERLKRFFTREDNGYRVNKDVREMIIFAVQNAIKDPPFTKLDLISCRNLLIYLESSLQKRVLSLFSYSLRPGGLLLLGTSESVSGFDERFLALDKRWKLFQRLSNANSQALPDFFHDRPATLGGEPHAVARDGQRSVHGLSSAAERVLLSSFVPPSVLVSERGEIIYVQGRIGMFFEPAQGEASQNLFSMAREGLRVELPTAVRKA